jgi:hypothetical protein
MNDFIRGKRRAICQLVALSGAPCLALGVAFGVAVGIGQPLSAQSTRTTWGIVDPSNSRSIASARANAARLDGIVEDWIQLDSITGLPSSLQPGAALSPAGQGHRLALVTSWAGQRFHPEVVRRIAGERGALALAASRIANIASSTGDAGIVIDIREQSREDLPLTLAFIAAVADSARRHGVTSVAVTVPATDTVAYPTVPLARVAEVLMVMLVDEHHASSGAGPLASPEWVRRQLALRAAEVSPQHLAAALPLYGMLWRQGEFGKMMSFDNARRAAGESAVELRRDPSTQWTHAVLAGSWDLWLPDAGTLRALLDEVAAVGVTRIAFWTLGLEDPAIWVAPRVGARPAVRR